MPWKNGKFVLPDGDNWNQEVETARPTQTMPLIDSAKLMSEAISQRAIAPVPKPDPVSLLESSFANSPYKNVPEAAPAPAIPAPTPSKVTVPKVDSVSLMQQGIKSKTKEGPIVSAPAPIPVAKSTDQDGWVNKTKSFFTNIFNNYGDAAQNTLNNPGAALEKGRMTVKSGLEEIAEPAIKPVQSTIYGADQAGVMQQNRRDQHSEFLPEGVSNALNQVGEVGIGIAGGELLAPMKFLQAARYLNTVKTAPGALSATLPNVAKGIGERLAGAGAKAALGTAAYNVAEGAMTPDIEDRNLAQTVGASLRAGTGDTANQLGAAAKWLGFDNLATDLQTYGANQKQGFDMDQEEFTWASLLDPEFYAKNVTRSLPTSLAIMPAGMAGAAAGGAIASAAGLGMFGRAIAQAFGASILSTPLEAAMEAGGVYEDERKKGKTAEEANKSANSTFWKNAALLSLTNTMEFGTLFAPKGISKVLDSPVGRIGTAAVTGAAEEGAQEVIARDSKGEAIKMDASMLEQMVIGGLTAAGFGAAGSFTHNGDSDPMQKIQSNVINKLSQQDQVEYREALADAKALGISEEEANAHIMDTIANQEEGQRIIQEVVADMMKDAGAAVSSKQAPELPGQTAAPAAETAPAEQEPAGQAGQTDDDLYNKAVDLVRSTGKVSIPQLQKKFKTGYTVNAKMIDRMEAEGIVSGYDGTNPRTVITSPDAQNAPSPASEVIPPVSTVEAPAVESSPQVDTSAATPTANLSPAGELAKGAKVELRGKPGQSFTVTGISENGKSINLVSEKGGELKGISRKAIAGVVADEVQQSEPPSGIVAPLEEDVTGQTGITKIGDTQFVYRPQKADSPKEREAFARKLNALGGKWSTKEKGYVFDHDPSSQLENLDASVAESKKAKKDAEDKKPKVKRTYQYEAPAGVSEEEHQALKLGDMVTVAVPQGEDNNGRERWEHHDGVVVRGEGFSRDVLIADPERGQRTEQTTAEDIVSVHGSSAKSQKIAKDFEANYESWNRGGERTKLTDPVLTTEDKTPKVEEKAPEVEEEAPKAAGTEYQAGDIVRVTDKKGYVGNEWVVIEFYPNSGNYRLEDTKNRNIWIATNPANIEKGGESTESVVQPEVEKETPKAKRKAPKAEEEAPKVTSSSELKKGGLAKDNLAWLKKMEEEARARIESRKGRVLSGLPMDDMVDYSVIGFSKMVQGTVEYAAWSKEMLDEFGDSIRLFLGGIYGQSQSMMEMSEDDLDEMIRLAQKDDGEVTSDGAIDSMGNDSEEALAGTQTEDVPAAPTDGETAAGTTGGTGTNEGRGSRDDSAGNEPSGSVGDSAGDVDTLAGRGDNADTGNESVELDSASPAVKQPTTGNYVIKDDELGIKGAKTSFRKNVEAIKLMKTIMAESRPATTEEQKVLVQYVGWGGIKQPFELERRVDKDWVNEYKELKELLTAEEWQKAADTILNAHYTSRDMIESLYTGLQHFGFDGGRVLEPSMGIGHFIGLMPSELAKVTRATGVEIDPITGNIGRLLYPKSDVRIMGFEDVKVANDFYDAAIGNVPFGDYGIADPAYKNTGMTSAIHNYFFAKALDKVRPGGIVMFITSRYTMDAQNSRVRKYIASKANLIGAVRLPNTAFKKNANTEVVTDILILQKRGDSIPAGDAAWIETGAMQIDNRSMTVNSYFLQNPDKVIGKLATTGSMYGGGELTVEPPRGDLKTAVSNALTSLPRNIITKREKKATEEAAPREIVPAPGHIKENAYTVHNNTLHVKQNDLLVPITLPKATADRVVGMIGVRNAVRDYLRLQLESNVSDATITASRKRLNQVYDAFVGKYGFLNEKTNARAFIDDPDSYLLLSLEHYDKDAGKATKADIFSMRTVQRYSPAESAGTAKEALVIALNEKGHVDLQHMSMLTKKSPGQIIDELKGHIFNDPNTGWVTSDEYLSGNVKEKFLAAQTAAQLDPAFEENVSALEAVQPTPLVREEIDTKLGSHWVPQEHIQDFATQLIGIRSDWLKVGYNNALAEWSVEATDTRAKDRLKYNTDNNVTWGTNAVSAIDLIEQSLNMRSAKVTVRYTDHEGNSVVDREASNKATVAARDKQNAIKDEFVRWLWSDESRANSLVQLYNDRFNTDRLRVFDGEHLTFPGMNPNITLKQHQKAAVWRAVQSGNTMFAHAVGAGKTYEMIASMMEMKRLGIANKPMWTVPNHLVDQMGADFLKLYPAANILVAGKKDFEAGKRKKLFAKIATGNYDAVIVPHSSFSKISMSKDVVESFYQQQLEELELAMDQEAQAGQRSETGLGKKIRAARKRLEEKMDKQLQKIEKDDNVSFEELGVDGLVVDEAHEFKNLFYSTKMSRVAGLGSQDGSGKAFDLFMKTRYMQRLNGGRGVIFATGTPVSNSLAEMYTFQRYLQYEELERRGINNFDSWVSQFGNVKNVLELSPEGKGLRMRTRLTEVVNLPELLHLFRAFADVKTADELLKAKLIKRPDLKDNKRIPVLVPATDELRSLVQTLADRAEDIRSGRVKPDEDNMLAVVGEGRKAALDMRLVDPSAEDHAESKVNIAAGRIADLHKQTKKIKLKDGSVLANGTQLVFLDLSTPRAEKTDKDGNSIVADVPDEETQSISIYNELRSKLVKRGVPAKDIAFIHDYAKDAQKEELFRKVNNGEIRILIGSTAKMGAGMNVQTRLKALHHLDVPWRPSDIEQREGRILRQGNMNDEVEIYAYMTEESFDAYMWQTIANKAKVVDQTMSGDLTARVVEDPSGMEMSANELKALASGDPRILELANLDKDVAELGYKRQGNIDALRTVRRDLTKWPKDIESSGEYLKRLQADVARRADTTGDKFTMTIGNKSFTDRKAAGAALNKAAEDATFESEEPKKIGTFGGFDIMMTVPLNPDAMVEFSLDGASTYKFGWAETPAGTVRSMESAIGGIDNRVSRLSDNIEEARKQLTKLQAQEKRLVEDTDKMRSEYETKLARKTLIESDLNVDKKADEEGTSVVGEDPRKADESHKGKTAEDRIAYDVNAAKDNGMGIVAPGFRSKPKTPLGTNFQVPDATIEQAMQKAHGMPKEKLLTKIRDFFTIFRNKLREFEHLPKTPQFELIRQKLLQLMGQESMAKHRTYQVLLQGITLPLSRSDYELFSRKVLIDDMYQEQQRGNALAFGFNDKQDVFDAYKLQLDAAVANNRRVADALKKRTAAWDGIKAAYFDAMGDIGVDVTDKLVREDYFRHQVIEYATQLRTGEGTKKLRTPANNRGFLKGRTGTFTGDYNTDYLQAEAEVMVQMMYDTEKAKVIKVVDQSYNEAKRFKAEAKAAGTNWQTLVEKSGTHKIWQPREGSLFYKKDAATSAGDVFLDVMNTLAADPAVVQDAMDRLNKAVGKPVFAMGGKRKEFVIPVEVAETLDSIMDDATDKVAIIRFNKAIMGVVKKWMLIGPKNFPKYNIRNTVSDLEKVLAGNPRAFRFVAKSTRELAAVYFKEGAGTPELRKYIERGGLQNLQQVQEMGDVQHLKMFARFYDGNKINLAQRAWNFYWRNARKVTDFREAIFRYANYLEYLEQMKDDPQGKPKNWGSSDRDRVMVLPDLRDRAYKMANELLVDYTATSTIGREIADTGYPFFRWVEGNMKSTSMLMWNAHKDGALATTVGRKLLGKAALKTPYYAYRAGRLAIQMSALTVLLAVFNAAVFPDEEKELPADVRNKIHIVFGRDKNGKVRYLDRLGFLEDYLEWFGLGNGVSDLRDVLDGKKTVQDTIAEGLLFPVNKAAQGVGPNIKVPTEMLTGLQFFPDVFNPSANHAWSDPLVNMLGLKKEIDAFKRQSHGVPGKAYDPLDMISMGSDPGEAAYYDLKDMASAYKKKNNITTGKAGERTEKSNALYNFKQALRYNDTIAQDRYLTEYFLAGGTSAGFNASLAALDPLFGLSQDHQAIFVDSLDAADTKIYDKAYEFYTDTLLGGQ